MSLQEVENAIRVMNQAAFQELGDLFMISRNRDYSAFVCTGSQYTHKPTKSRNISAFSSQTKCYAIFAFYRSRSWAAITSDRSSIKILTLLMMV